MSDEPSSSPSAANGGRVQERSWLDRLLQSFSTAPMEPRTREELLSMIREAANNKLVDQEAVNIMEGALSVANKQVREIMVPRAQLVHVKIDDPPSVFLPTVIKSGHSRFPVVGESIDEIKGILLAKDLLPLILEPREDFNLGSILRPANIIPESKRLNVLLREFREKRYHMALVIDEFGGIAGLVTIEDILEQIVGDIEDETDEDETDDFIRQVSDREYVIKALTPIEDFNEHFKTHFSNDEFDTIGGLVTRAFGHMPVRNEHVELGGYNFRVLYSDSRQIHLLRLTLPAS